MYGVAMARAGNIVHEKFTARYTGTAQFISSFIIVELLVIPFARQLSFLTCPFEGVYLHFRRAAYPTFDRRLIFHNVGSWKTGLLASDR